MTTSAILGAPLAVTTSTAVADTASPKAAAPQSPEARAQAEAKKSGKPVEIAELADEFNETLANPDGTFTRRAHVEPVRAKVDGAWRTPDATLRKGADGRLSPTASTFPIAFSGGGTAPLATMTRDGQTLSVSWPTALPTPTVSGSTAVYADVLPGVDLKVLADVDGFAEHLVVKTREAAANPALAELKLLTKADGLTVENTEDGGIKAKGKDGRTVFQAPAPTMWDTPKKAKAPRGMAVSEAQEGTEPAALPVKAARIGVKVKPGEIGLTPDKSLLTSPDVQFPLVIDPVFTGGGRQKWSFTASSYPGSAFVSGSGWTSNNPTDEFRLGYSGDSKHQSFFTVDTNGLSGAQILSSTLHTVETHSWGCTASSAGYTDLWVVGAWDHDPTWNWPLPRIEKVASDSFAGGNDTYCPNDLGHDFVSDGLKYYVQRMADENSSALTLSLAAEAGMEGNTFSYKRFKNNPYLEITYNRAPVVNEYAAYEGSWVPNGDGNKPIPCDTNPATWPIVGNSSVTLAARVSDPDGTNTTAHFEVWPDGGAGAVQSFDSYVGSGSWATDSVPADTFLDGRKYRWSVLAKDGITQSAATTNCGFTVDRTAPTGLTVTATDGKRLDVADVPARVARTLKFTAADTNLAGFCWTLEQPISTSNTRCQNGTWVDAVNGSATATVTPTSWPNSRLHVVAYDKAGNRSADAAGGAQLIVTAPADFVRPAATAGTPAVRDLPGDLTGDGYPDVLTVSPQGALRLNPGTGSGVSATPIDLGKGWAGALVTHRGDLAGNSATTADADGYEDFVIRPASGPDAGKLFVYPNDGLGHPNPATRHELIHPTKPDWSEATQILAAGNLDGKAGDDLVTVEGGKLYLYSGRVKGGGTVDTANPFDLAGRTELGTSGWTPLTVTAPGDVNGDGINDLVTRNTATGALRLYTGKGGGATAYSVNTAAAYGTIAGSRAAFLSLGNIQGAVTNVAGYYDANDNGTQDANEPTTTYRRYNATTGQESADLLALTPADGSATVSYTDDGTTTKTTTCPNGCVLAYPAGSATAGTLPRLAATSGAWGADSLEGPSPLGTRLMRDRTDYNKDGWTDILARDSDGNMWVYPGSGGSGVGAYGARKLVCSGCGPYAAWATDFDGDRIADLILRDSSGTLNLWRGNGTPGDGTNWIGPTRIGIGWGSLRLDFGDLNNDGKVDAVAVDAAGDMWLYPGTGVATADSQLGSPTKIGTGWNGFDFLVGDMNNDGLNDVVGTWQANGNMYLYAGTGGTGMSTLGGSALIGTGWYPAYHRPQIADVNNDGLTDILDRDSDGNLWWYLGSGGTGTSTIGGRSLVGWGWQTYDTYQ
ncbi:FG-GAP repeat domain-containing protein [Kitasatospora sp. NPDC048365]|uniref:FG-GAP repeat domain-containing protein n=1 Tax=Kitasatospora sp. NPDC048365 TaxID=3364050 RepID=UPI003717AA40